MRCRTRLTLLLLPLCGLTPPAAGSGPLPERFTLGRYMPGDVWMFIHHARNPERAWLDEKWAEVFDAIRTSGAHKDLASLVLSLSDEEKRDDTQATLDKWTRLIDAVRWRDLLFEEAAFAERIGGERTSPVEYMLLARGKAGTTDANVKALVAILEELAGLSEEVSLTKGQQGELQTWSLACCGRAAKDFPFSLQLFRKGDVIGAASGKRSLTDILALMGGERKKLSIVASPRFTEALGSVEAPEQGVLFFDFKALVDGLGRLFEMVAAESKSAEVKNHRNHGERSGAEDRQILLGAVREAIALFDVMDYGIHSFEMKDRRELVHEITRFQKDKRNCALTCCFLDRKPFKKFDRFVPVDATGFSVTGLIDFEKLYDVVTGFVGKSLPNGDKHLAKWNEILASVGFDPKEDFFSWWSGEMVSVTLPPAVVTPMSQPESVRMFRVKDSALASKKLDAALDFISAKLEAQGQPAVISPAPISVPGFRQISHPILMMMMVRPVFGVKDGWLFVSSSADSLNRCLLVAAGKAPSIAENERFKREGLIPKGAVQSCSFSDISTFGQDLAKAAGMAGMIGQMMTAQIPDGRETGKIKTIVQRLGGIAMKLAPALQKIDFYSSEASMTTYDGSLTLRTERIITYKPPVDPKSKSAEAK